MPDRWLYLLTVHPGFLDPLEDLNELLVLVRSHNPSQLHGGAAAYLLLPARRKGDVPLKNAAAGTEILFCTRISRVSPLMVVGSAITDGPATSFTTPPNRVPSAYKHLTDRFFLPIRAASRHEHAHVLDDLTPDQQRRFANGQAWIRRLPPRSVPFEAP
jgi:hypothetical protein